VVAIVGPTAAGKSALAVEVARAFAGEVVSCDALQVYRELDIGTSKPAAAERRGVAHHLLDVVRPDEEFSAAQYISLAAPVVFDIVARGRLPVLVGGTGLYLRALRSGLFEGPGRSASIRERLSRIADRRGPGALHRILTRWDPPSAARIHPNDRVRLVRGIEVFLASGRPMSELMRERKSPLQGFRDILVGLRPGRERLLRRITDRVDAMYSRGLLGEVRRLQADYGAGIPAFKAIGYREALLLLAGEIDASGAKELTVRATIQYAKRQMTWFRREPGVAWFDGSGDDREIQTAVVEYLRRSLPEAGGLRTPSKEVSC
jgi:tRNA dimethylallyltransferase